MTGSLNSFDPNSPEHLKVAPIEADKHKDDVEIPINGKTVSSIELTRFTFLTLLHRYTMRFLGKQEHYATKDLFSTLKHLKSLLERLSAENVSQNYLFAEDLSRHWHILIRLLNDEARNRRTPPYLKPLQLWIQTIDTYPEASDHSLGYYLTRFTGEKWLPFPFMDILQKLHEDAILLRNTSTLSKWIRALDTPTH